MADDRSMLEKLLNMLAADDMTALVAVRKIRAMAEKEKKTVGDLCLSGKVIYQERVVYRDRAPERGPVRDDIWEAMRRARRDNEDTERARQARKDEERRQQERQAKERYGSAFDDAEMSDEEREKARAKRQERRNERHARRILLGDLEQALKEDDDDLTAWEIEFASTVPFQYSYDYELSRNQKFHAERIIRKVRINKQGSPI